jgi:hypothetical protein
VKLFDIQVFTSDREFDVTLRNLSIIRASEIIHRIRVASTALLRAIKRFLVPGKVVIAPLIKLRNIKFLRQHAEISIDTQALLSSQKRAQVNEALQISANSSMASAKRVRDNPTWRATAEALLGAKKSGVGSAALAFDVGLRMQKVRKRRLGEVSHMRPVEMDAMTLEELDYIIEP